MLLVELFEGTREFGRTLEDFVPGETIEKPWKLFDVGGELVKVKMGGNNDMYKGVILGLTVASLSVPESDRQFHERLAKVTKLILGLKVQNKSNTNQMLSYGLAAIVLKDPAYRAKFIASSDSFVTEFYSIYDGTFYWNGTSDYSGINLAVVGLYTGYLMANALKAPDALTNLEEQALIKKRTFGELRHWQILLLLKKMNQSLLTREELLSVTESINTIPYPSPDLTVKYDHTWDDSFCLSPIPWQFWKAYKNEVSPASHHLASLTNHPIYKTSGIDSNFIFKNPYFRYEGAVDRHYRSSRIDLLFAWALLEGH